MQETSCCTEMSCETFRLAPAAPCSAMARTTSRSVNMPTAVLPSVRTTSLTTSALILLERISWAAMATVSFIRIVATRAVFLRSLASMTVTRLAGDLGGNHVIEHRPDMFQSVDPIGDGVLGGVGSQMGRDKQSPAMGFIDDGFADGTG